MHKIETVETRFDQTCSVELSRSTKGDYSWSIKVYCDGEFASALQRIGETDAQLRRQYLAPGSFESPLLHHQPEPVALADAPAPPRIRKEAPPAPEQEVSAAPSRGRRKRSDALVEQARKPFPSMRPDVEEREEEEEEAPPRFPRRRKGA